MSTSSTQEFAAAIVENQSHPLTKRPDPIPEPSAIVHGLSGPVVVQTRPPMKDPQNGNLALGRAVHASLTQNFRQKIETREDLPVSGVLALFQEAWAPN